MFIIPRPHILGFEGQKTEKEESAKSRRKGDEGKPPRYGINHEEDKKNKSQKNI